ncbi:hypothetical protein GOODEAATRI_000072 [Goodea atripinnis]|uniref:Uncharacterized protein n=1 Tax=Goodea atripinnis TaxID=208336 RepID=A0ABV0MDQ3_9TELE
MCEPAMQRDRPLMVSNGQGLLVADTKPLLCNQLGVKSALTKADKGRGLVAGVGVRNTAVTRACTSRLNMGSLHIRSRRAPASARSTGQWGPSADPFSKALLTAPWQGGCSSSHGLSNQLYHNGGP